MRRLMVFLILMAGLAFGARAEAALKVVTSTPDLASIAKEVGGANIELTSLALSTQDPHFVDAKPHLDRFGFETGERTARLDAESLKQLGELLRW